MPAKSHVKSNPKFNNKMPAKSHVKSNPKFNNKMTYNLIISHEIQSQKNSHTMLQNSITKCHTIQ
jgi:hypothetical protein